MDIKAIVLAFIMLVMWVFQIVALAGKQAIVKNGGCGAGLFDSECHGWSGDGLTDARCGDVKDHARAVAAFGVIAVLVMSFCLIIHVIMAIPPAKSALAGNSVMQAILNYIFAVHFVNAFFLLLCWAITAGMYDRKLCGSKLKWGGNDLSYGFAFFIVNMVLEIIVGVLCMMGWHGGSSAKSTADPF
eukprot:TRINITY_DN1374_c0_g1_i2.p1 TRINITY_DN1374_c0_g1~~TRINITY_DN1374_c0_g1_i2.p1  ORF type:complete len:187 (+),score=75.41 TRINITY_DN1374_c0_g1_i2:64-624(+)